MNDHRLVPFFMYHDYFGNKNMFSLIPKSRLSSDVFPTCLKTISTGHRQDICRATENCWKFLDIGCAPVGSFKNWLKISLDFGHLKVIRNVSADVQPNIGYIFRAPKKKPINLLRKHQQNKLYLAFQNFRALKRASLL